MIELLTTYNGMGLFLPVFCSIEGQGNQTTGIKLIVLILVWLAVVACQCYFPGISVTLVYQLPWYISYPGIFITGTYYSGTSLSYTQ